MKNILITGNSGYIGSHLCKLLANDYDITGLDINKPQCKIPNHIYHDIKNNFPMKKIHYDAVIHLAALVNVGESEQKPTDYYLTNFIGTLNLLTHVDTDNFIFASTGAAEYCQSVYGTSKRAAEDCVKEIVKKVSAAEKDLQKEVNKVVVKIKTSATDVEKNLDLYRKKAIQQKNKIEKLLKSKKAAPAAKVKKAKAAPKRTAKKTAKKK